MWDAPYKIGDRTLIFLFTQNSEHSPNFEDIPPEFHHTVDGGHGRIETRRYWLLDRTEHLVDAHLWPGLKRVGMVESERRLPGKAPTFERRYYLVSLEGGIQRFAHAVRSHWGKVIQGNFGKLVSLGKDPGRRV